eukprot:GFKZ01000874.1.p1 GENE.GFKZ01000874.1~~GFKZ01000874.1.p1  ORF type:complete len:160 (-),score=21.20 GFKZ01000874.1:304-783(-)
MAENFSTTSATAGNAADTHNVPEPDVNAASKSDPALDGEAEAMAKLEIPASDTPAKITDEHFIKDVVNKTVDQVIRDAGYSHEATSIWVNQIVEIVVRSLVKVDRDNKYIVTCMIVQNLRQGMRSATSCYWSSRTDSGYSLTNERNGMYVITTVFICQP